MTQEELAGACGLHSVYISMLERGERPTLDKDLTISEKLGDRSADLAAEVNAALSQKRSSSLLSNPSSIVTNR